MEPKNSSRTVSTVDIVPQFQGLQTSILLISMDNPIPFIAGWETDASFLHAGSPNDVSVLILPPRFRSAVRSILYSQVSFIVFSSFTRTP